MALAESRVASGKAVIQRERSLEHRYETQDVGHFHFETCLTFESGSGFTNLQGVYIFKPGNLEKLGEYYVHNQGVNSFTLSNSPLVGNDLN